MIPRVDGLVKAVLSPPRSLSRFSPFHHQHPIHGTTVLITGASQGIGETTAHAFAEHGATVILVARDADRLDAVRDAITAAGGRADAVVADLTDDAGVDALVATVTERFGTPDILVNNAGRSIRRSVVDTVDRFHDYERTMAINYFGAVRLTTALLPAMIERGSGQIINVVTWGVVAGSMPKFAAYHASKAALAAFGRSLDDELSGTGVTVSNIGFPLVRTPMIAPTTDYDDAPALDPDDAAAWIIRAAHTRQPEIYPRYAELLRAVSAVSPRVTGRLIRAIGI
ncbi:MAG: SDR family NAD(P)-dependent oxidoreductase [Gordonia sp. (in: high G+C Gram-positive bacteria)]|uniref:SDR family NAD(P)-dependent oxidoreductase n=1 Tax=Gordonia sp. (in: high G+C Gram-positive bacteria) TaxID=84139 RepID=UPI0039E5E5A0